MTTKNATPTFKIGDKVKWTAKNTKKRHTGKVVKVIPANALNVMSEQITRELRNRGYNGYQRDHRSYVIQDAKGRHYWPHVAGLKKA